MATTDAELILRARNLTAAAFAEVSKALKVLEGDGTSAGKGIAEGVKQAKSELSGLQGIIQSAIGSFAGFVSAQAVMSAVSGAFRATMGAAIDMNSTLETSTLQFTTLMGDADKAKSHVKDLFEIAKKTPFETGPIIEASKKLQVFGGEALNTKKNILMIGDASAATGAPINELGFWVGRLYSNIKGGQPIGEAAMRLQELAVLTPQTRQQIEALGNSTADGTKKWEIFTASMGHFGGAMEKQAGTWQGVTSTLKDSLNMLAADALKPVFEAVRDGIGGLNEFLGSDGVAAAGAGVADVLTKALTLTKDALHELNAAMTDTHSYEIAAGTFLELANQIGFLASNLTTTANVAPGARAALRDVISVLNATALKPVADAAAALELLNLAILHFKGYPLPKLPTPPWQDESLHLTGGLSAPKAGASTPPPIIDAKAAKAAAKEAAEAFKEWWADIIKSRDELGKLQTDLGKSFGLMVQWAQWGQKGPFGALGEDLASISTGVGNTLASLNQSDFRVGMQTTCLAIEGVTDNSKRFSLTLDDVQRKVSTVTTRAQENVRQIRGAWSPAWQEISNTITHGISAALAGLLTGALGFKDAFLEVWKSIQRSLTKVLDDLLNDVIGGFIKRLRGSITDTLAGAAAAAVSPNTLAGISGGSGSTLASLSKGGGASSAGYGYLAAGVGAGLVGYGTGYAVGSKGTGAAAGAAAGAATGASIGAMSGTGVGVAYGAAIGAVVGGISGWIGAQQKIREENNAATQQIKTYEVELVRTYGSMERITQMSQILGVDLIGAWGSASQAGLVQFKNLMDEFTIKQQALDAATQAYGITWEDMGDQIKLPHLQDAAAGLIGDLSLLTSTGVDSEKAITRMAPAFNDVLAAGLRTGEGIPPALAPVLKQLSEMGLLTEDNQRALLGLAALPPPVDWRAMETAAQKYGIQIAVLGHGFDQAKITEAASTIVADFEMLTKSGADANGVLDGMKDEIQTIVQDSVKLGTEIPANMKPLIESLIESGGLFDENGDKITDISKLKFAAPLETESDKLKIATDKISDAIDRLIGKFSDLIAIVLPPKTLRVDTKLNDPDGLLDGTDDGSGQEGGSEHPPEHASGAYIARDHLARVHAGELIGPVSFMAAALAGALRTASPAATAGPLHVHVYLKNREIAEAVADDLPGVLRARGLL